MLLAKDVMDVQQDVPVHVKQFVSLFVRVVQVNVKAVLAVQVVMVVKMRQLVQDVLLHAQVVLDVLVLVKQDVQANVKAVLVVIAVQGVQVVLVA